MKARQSRCLKPPLFLLATLFVFTGISCSDGSSQANGPSRCEEATFYLAAASVTAYDYTQAIAFNLFAALYYDDPAKRAEAAAVFLSGVEGDTDDFSRLRVPAGFEQFRDHLVETGQEVARGMRLISEQRIDEASDVFFALAEPDAVLQYLPEWVIQCPEPSQ